MLMKKNSLVLVVLVIFTSVWWGCSSFTNNAKTSLTVEKNSKDGTVLQWNTPEFKVRIHPPLLNVEQGQEINPVSLQLQSHSLNQNKAILQYEILVENGEVKFTGSYVAEIELPDSGNYLHQTSRLVFKEELKLNLSVTSSFVVTKPSPSVAPRKRGWLRGPT